MVKSTSCFKIIACGGDSAEKDDLEAYENKGSSEKRGWSFRKRSARHRVLSNTVIAETPVSGKKESPESANLNFQSSADITVSEKISAVQCIDEKPQLPIPENTKVDETVVATEVESVVDTKPDESLVIVIQTAVRMFMAQRALLKLSNVVRLQAAVRGHLVRRHAVGTLRCVQAIVKMQALVRARRARLSLEGSYPVKNSKENLAAKSNVSYTSIEKLLSNKFARQLLESTPKTKPIHVKCDLSKPDSAWLWLERWMSVSAADIAETTKPMPVTEQWGGKKEDNLESQLNSGIQSEVFSETADSKFSIEESVVAKSSIEESVVPKSSIEESVVPKSSIEESVVPSESEENLITYEADNFHFQASQSTSLVKDNFQQPQVENTGAFDVKETSIDTSFLPNQTVQSDADFEVEQKAVSRKLEIEIEQPKRSVKRSAPEQLETEGKKFISGSRKASNPAFIAAHSKFEELSSTINSCKSISSSYQEAGIESEDTISSGAHPTIRTKEIGVAESPALFGSRFQVGGSECGTELSITSTLDSPDISDGGAVEYDHEAKVVDEGISDPNSIKNPDIEAKDVSTIPASSLSPSVPDQPEKLNVINGESIHSVAPVDSPQIEQRLERNKSDNQREPHSNTGVQAYGSSPEASPRSHMTALESQGTPSSQVSVKARKNKTGKSGSSQKRSSLSTGKKSPSNANQDSGARSSVEKLSKEKNGKRRNSFGSARPDQTDQEPRDSSANSSLPHFMQATESARAKLLANNSPRSSPDAQERDNYIKKRHSLPGANGRQGSPRIQRSISQAQQGSKGNERKWQR